LLNPTDTIIYTPTELHLNDFLSLMPNRENNQSDIHHEVFDAYFHILSTTYPDIKFIPNFVLQIFFNTKSLYDDYDFKWPISSLRYILIPISMTLGQHWGLAVVNLKERVVTLMDAENLQRKAGSGTEKELIKFYGDLMYVFTIHTITISNF
jgi:Ulp1 family protease